MLKNSKSSEKLRTDSGSIFISTALYPAKNKKKIHKYSIDVQLIPKIQVIQKNSINQSFSRPFSVNIAWVFAKFNFLTI
jgi:hypothetical protein